MELKGELPVAVTIAGSDSGGGAGIQADLKTFAALGVHGLTVITNITAQSPTLVRAVEPCSVSILRRQLETVYGDFRPAATKIGMLYTAEIARAVSRFLRRVKPRNVVIDPVMISTSGRPLLKRDAIVVLRDELFPLAAVLTPNVPEAESLLGRRISNLEETKRASRALHDLFGCAILLKGGHLQHTKDALDVLFDGKREMIVSGRRVRRIKTHGTGCVYSAAIAAYLASGRPLTESVRAAKRYVTGAISKTTTASGHPVLGW